MMYTVSIINANNQCLESLEMIDVEFNTAFPLIRMDDCYIWWWWMDSSSLSSITYEVWWGYSTRETADTKHCCRPIYSLYQYTLRLTSFAFTLIMTSPCFITPTVVVVFEKEGVSKPDVPNNCYWYVWRGNGKGYMWSNAELSHR